MKYHIYFLHTITYFFTYFTMTAPWSTLVSVRCAGCGTRRRFTGTVLHANIFFYHLSEPHFVCYVINFTFAIWNVGDHKVTRREHLSEHKKSRAWWYRTNIINISYKFVSVAAGHLIYECSGVDKRTIKKLEKDAQEAPSMPDCQRNAEGLLLTSPEHSSWGGR